jgi:hypothetical protein
MKWEIRGGREEVLKRVVEKLEEGEEVIVGGHEEEESDQEIEQDGIN